MSQFTAIDLFSGAGGFSLAAQELGFDILAAVELDKHAASTYKKNILKSQSTITKLYNSDINEIDIDILMSEQNIKSRELDLLLGGPPCQGFSSHRINDSGKGDPRNQLLIKYFDFVKKLMPKVFLVENVPGLLWDRHEQYLNKFLELTHKHNYKIVTGNPFLINARDYGAPQNRRRAFILAVRGDVKHHDLEWPPSPTHIKPDYSKKEIDKNIWNTASIAFEKPPNDILNEFALRMHEVLDIEQQQAKKIINSLKFGSKLNESDWCNRHMAHKPFMIDRFKDTKIMGSRDESEFRLACHLNYSGHKDVYGRMFLHTPSNTITTGCHNPSKGRFLHPWENHGITLRHAARLQTFPDHFEFVGGVVAAAKQIGNAVPICLASALISSIKKNILEKRLMIKNAA